MLEYAAGRRQIAARPSCPNAMLVIISAHVALLAFVMSAKMDLPSKLIFDPPTKIDLIPEPLPPKPQAIRHASPQPHQTPSLQPRPEVPIAPSVQPTIDAVPSIDFGKVLGPAVNPTVPQPVSPSAPVFHEARLLTPGSELKPPYPASKLASEEEATLRLRLTIDEQGRVTAVDPVGSADRIFLDSARRYLIAHWRYAPATKDGRAIPSSLTVTLRFELDG
jgi:protein TonB